MPQVEEVLEDCFCAGYSLDRNTIAFCLLMNAFGGCYELVFRVLMPRAAVARRVLLKPLCRCVT